MKILIQDTITKWYFQKNQWVATVEEAYEFKTTAEAIALGMKLGLNHFEILHVFPESQHNFGTGMMDFSKPALRPTLPPL